MEVNYRTKQSMTVVIKRIQTANNCSINFGRTESLPMNHFHRVIMILDCYSSPLYRHNHEDEALSAYHVRMLFEDDTKYVGMVDPQIGFKPTNTIQVEEDVFRIEQQIPIKSKHYLVVRDSFKKDNPRSVKKARFENSTARTTAQLRSLIAPTATPIMNIEKRIDIIGMEYSGLRKREQYTDLMEDIWSSLDETGKHTFVTDFSTIYYDSSMMVPMYHENGKPILDHLGYLVSIMKPGYQLTIGLPGYLRHIAFYPGMIPLGLFQGTYKSGLRNLLVTTLCVFGSTAIKNGLFKMITPIQNMVTNNYCFEFYKYETVENINKFWGIRNVSRNFTMRVLLLKCVPSNYSYIEKEKNHVFISDFFPSVKHADKECIWNRAFSSRLPAQSCLMKVKFANQIEECETNSFILMFSKEYMNSLMTLDDVFEQLWLLLSMNTMLGMFQARYFLSLMTDKAKIVLQRIVKVMQLEIPMNPISFWLVNCTARQDPILGYRFTCRCCKHWIDMLNNPEDHSFEDLIDARCDYRNTYFAYELLCESMIYSKKHIF